MAVGQAKEQQMYRNLQKQENRNFWTADVRDAAGTWGPVTIWAKNEADAVREFERIAESHARIVHTPDMLAGILADAARYGTGGD